MPDNLTDYLADAMESLRLTREHKLDQRVESAIAAIVKPLRARLPLLVCGNGGSAADALHITGELVGRFAKERKGLNVIALTANPAVLTAWPNDYDFESVFARQVESHGVPGAVLLGISTSGNSKNVISAFRTAKEMGMTTIALTGQNGGQLAPWSDILLDVPLRSTPRIQEAHICLYHFICQQVEERCAK